MHMFHDALVSFAERRVISMDENNKQNKPTGEKKGGKRGFSLPPTTSKPPMPPVKPPKKK